MTDDPFLRCVMRAAFDLPTPVREIDPGPSIAAIASKADAKSKPIIVTITAEGPLPDRCACAPPPTLH
jgi:hypothetical protein